MRPHATQWMCTCSVHLARRRKFSGGLQRGKGEGVEVGWGVGGGVLPPIVVGGQGRGPTGGLVEVRWSHCSGGGHNCYVVDMCTCSVRHARRRKY
jgi:hypothetical protein